MTTRESPADILANIEHRHPTLEQATAIAASHRIDDVQALHEHLCDLKEAYYEADALNAALSTPPSAKKKLKSIQRTLEKLLKQIDDLDEGESFWLWKALHGYKGFWRPLFQRFTEANASDRDEEHVLPDGRINLNKIERDDVIEIINRLNVSAVHGVENISSGGAGRKPKVGLFFLVFLQQAYWENTLSRHFTFDEHNGEGITPAYLFCLDAVRIIDPSIMPTEIKSQMRKIIADKRQEE